MTAEPDLGGLRVLVPRPRPAGERTAEYLAMLGAKVAYHPALAIRCIPAAGAAQAGDTQYNNADLVVFVSVNSVQCLGAEPGQPETLCGPDTLVATMGGATASACADLGIEVSFMPRGSADSEGLIRALDGTGWEGKKVVIVRGRGGRDEIREYLQRQGAQVSYLEVYERQVASAPSAHDLDRWGVDGFHAVVVSSVALFEALLTVLDNKAEKILEASVLVCPSARVGDACRNLGFKRILIAQGPSDEETARALAQIASQGS